MTKECFYELADELRPFIAPHPDSPILKIQALCG